MLRHFDTDNVGVAGLLCCWRGSNLHRPHVKLETFKHLGLCPVQFGIDLHGVVGGDTQVHTVGVGAKFAALVRLLAALILQGFGGVPFLPELA